MAEPPSPGVAELSSRYPGYNPSPPYIGGWCNRQHPWFWSTQSGFESWSPSYRNGGSTMAVRAIVLSAGKGTRMKSDLAKVLHPVAGRRLLHWVLDAVAATDCAETVVVVGHQAEDVRSILPPDVHAVLQAEQLGTGHATSVGLGGLDVERGDDVSAQSVAATASRTQCSSRRPATGCRTFARSDFILVPFPAPRTIALTAMVEPPFL